MTATTKSATVSIMGSWPDKHDGFSLYELFLVEKSPEQYTTTKVYWVGISLRVLPWNGSRQSQGSYDAEKPTGLSDRGSWAED